MAFGAPTVSPGTAPAAGGVARRSTVPRATYRLQLRGDLDLVAAVELVPYLERLGVSHVYASPLLQAASGSTHGYDVVDPGRVDPALGGQPAFDALARALADRGMGLVLDIVPNHMAISGRDNPWWWDVLENGPSSRFAPFFDVDWDPPETYLRNRILMPVLADHYGRVLEAGEIRIERDKGSFVVRVGDRRFPVAPRSLDTILKPAADRSRSRELADLCERFAALPSSAATDRESVRRRHVDKETLRVALATLLANDQRAEAAVDDALASLNADVDALDAFLGRQNYRLAFWRAADRDLPYRRFFDVTSLVGLRVEDERVFAETHATVLEAIGAGAIDGLRVDHPDGLRDPKEYFERLREAAPKSWVVAEKILEPGEPLRSDWPIEGTTGYDFLRLVGGLFVDQSAEAEMTRIYRNFTGDGEEFGAVAREGKRVALRDLLGSELNRLTALFVVVCEGHRRYRDYTRHDLHEALREVAACFPVYRSYVRAEAGEIAEADRAEIDAAVTTAIAERPDLDPGLFEFLGSILKLDVRGERESELVMRFQQLTGAVMAKGVEDTAFYRWFRLASLNEVGDDPSIFGVSPGAFHATCVEAAERRGATMLSTATHDTKRGEDVRLRIHALSEIPGRWAAALQRWLTMNDRHHRGEAPGRDLEYLYYQTLVGTWPIETPRIVEYMRKAAREAKLRTSWTAPDESFEQALTGFIETTLADRTFRADLDAFVGPVAAAARISSLAQTLIKLTAPGVPDIYQGTELWDGSLVDPDNRRPVDWASRRRLLNDLSWTTPERVMAGLDEGLPKLWTIHRALDARRRRPELFAPDAGYAPLAATGTRPENVVAFVRGGAALTVAPRLVMGLRGSWGDTMLAVPHGRWRNELTGDVVEGRRTRLAELLGRFPVALLVREPDV